MNGLTSAGIPPVEPEDHVRGEGEEGIVVYADLRCPRCAAEWQQPRDHPLRVVFRRSPVASTPPRSPPRHGSSEAAGLQGRFFEMVDSLYADRGRVDDPHLWERAERLGLDLRRFEEDRRLDSTQARVRRDFESGIRAGVTSTPGV